MRRDWLICLALFAVACSIFWGGIDCSFSMDDNGLIMKAKLIRDLHHIPELFQTDYWYPSIVSGLYRPLVKLSYALNYAYGKLDPRGYHLVNVLLHGLMSALVYLLFRRLVEDRWVAAGGAFLFAALAVHTEIPVNAAFGRTELLAGLFSIGVLLLHIQRSQPGARHGALLYALGLGCFGLGLLSKESAVTIIGVVAAYDFCFRSSSQGSFPQRAWRTLRENFLRSYLGYVAVLAVYMVVRTLVLSDQKTLPPQVAIDNPLVGLPQPWRLLNALYVAFHYVWLLIWPQHLSYDYSYNAIPLFQRWQNPRLAITLALCAGAAALVVFAYRRSRILFFSIAFFAITFSIVSNVFLLIGTITGERLLYFPSIGYCLALAAGLGWLSRKLPWQGRAQRAALGSVLALVVGLHAARAVVRTRDWKTQYTLFLHDVEVVPGSAKAQNNAGAILAQKKQYEEALVHLKRAIEISPLGYPVPYYTAALTYTTLGRDDEAIPMYQHAILNGDRDPITRNNLGYLLVDKEIDIDGGVELLEEAVHMMPDNAEFRDSLAWGYYKQRRYADARAEMEKAIRMDDSGKPHPERKEKLRKILAAQQAELARSGAGMGAGAD